MIYLTIVPLKASFPSSSFSSQNASLHLHNMISAKTRLIITARAS